MQFSRGHSSAFLIRFVASIDISGEPSEARGGWINQETLKSLTFGACKLVVISKLNFRIITPTAATGQVENNSKDEDIAMTPTMMWYSVWNLGYMNPSPPRSIPRLFFGQTHHSHNHSHNHCHNQNCSYSSSSSFSHTQDFIRNSCLAVCLSLPFT